MKTRRATALPPDERRSMIVAATLPLLLEHGDRVTSRQIAEAAGIAEGTIFRAFADKDEIIAAVIEAALDPEPLEAALSGIPDDLAFEDALAAAVVIMQQRVIDIWRLVSSVGTRFHEMTRRPMVDSDALVRMFEANRARITVEPIVAARLLRAHAVDDPSDARGRTAYTRRARTAVPARRRRQGPVVLTRLLKSHLGPYRRALWLIVVLQTVQTSAALTLPTINARIIDKGVIAGNTHYIYTWGAIMLVFALIQVAFSVAAVYWGGMVAMSFGRDLRKNLFHKVTDFSARGRHVRRTLADHPHHQRRATGADARRHGRHDGRRRTDHDGGRCDPGRTPGRRALGHPRDRDAGRRRDPRSDRVAHGSGVPADAGTHRPGEPGAARADHRHPGGAGLRARAAGSAAVQRGERGPHRGVAARGPADVVDVPDGELPHQRVERRRALVGCEPGELRGTSRSAPWSRTSATSCRS